MTGSTQGIGRAIAATLADAGARVAINGRRAESVDETIAQLHAESSAAGSSTAGSSTRQLVAAAGDVTTEPGAAAVVAAAGDVDILVNNLGIFGAVPPLDITDEQWRRYFDVNVLSAVRLIRSTLPGMTARGWGRVLNIASDSAIVIPAEMIHYGMSKTALLAVSRGFAKEAAGTGVTVNSVIAGPTHTGGVEQFVYELVDHDLPWDEAQREFMRVHRPPVPAAASDRTAGDRQHGGLPLLAPGVGDHGGRGPCRRRIRRLDPPLTARWPDGTTMLVPHQQELSVVPACSSISRAASSSPSTGPKRSSACSWMRVTSDESSHGVCAS